MRLGLTTVVIAMLMSLTGCSINQISGDLRDIELVAAIAVDSGSIYNKEETGKNDDDFLQVAVQVLHRDKALEKQYSNSYYQQKANGGSMAKAVAGFGEQGMRQLNFAHTGLLVLGDGVASPEYWLEYVANKQEIRPTIYPLLVEENAAEMLAEDYNGLSAVYLLQNELEPLGGAMPGAMSVTLQDWLVTLYQPGIVPMLPYAVVADLPKLVGMAAWDGLCWQNVSGEECRAWRILQRGSHLHQEVLALPGEVTVEVRTAQADWQVNGDSLQCKVKLTAKVQENSENLSDENVADRLSEQVGKILESAVAAAKERRLDFLGLGREIWRRQPKHWQQIANNNDSGNYLSRLVVDFDIAAEIVK